MQETVLGAGAIKRRDIFLNIEQINSESFISPRTITYIQDIRYSGADASSRYLKSLFKWKSNNSANHCRKLGACWFRVIAILIANKKGTQIFLFPVSFFTLRSPSTVLIHHSVVNYAVIILQREIRRCDGIGKYRLKEHIAQTQRGRKWQRERARTRRFIFIQSGINRRLVR